MSVVPCDPTLDRTHEQAAAASECAEWQLWLLMEGKAPRSRDDYLRSAAALLRANMGTAFAEFTPAQVMAHIASYPRGSQRKVRAHMQSWFSWGVLTGHLTRNPLERVPKIKREQQKIVEVFNDAEMAALEGLPVRDGALFTLMFHGGLRKGECIRLRRRDVSIDRGELLVLKGKGSKSRVVPFATDSPIVRAMLDLDFIERVNQEDHLWYTVPGGASVIARDKPVGEGTFHRWYARCLNTAGVVYVPRTADRDGVHNPHVTRHTFVTRALRRGVPLEVVSKWVGHASIATTADIYGHLNVEDTRRYLHLLEVEG